nr:reverse transcriptase domain-containing protein [Tanacetum cinerariifolium]
TFPADFVIVDYESDPRVPLILGRPFLRTAHTLIDVHREEIILHDGDERLTLNMIHDSSSYSNQPQKESINMINIFNDSCEDFLKDLFATNHQRMDSILEDSIDKDNLADLNYNLVDTMPEMFTDEHALDYSSPSLYDEYDDDLFEVESSDFLLSLEYDSFLLEDFSEVDALPSTNNEDKVFNPGILIQENLFEVITCVAPDKYVKKIAISHASLILEDFDPPLSLYELPFHKEVTSEDCLEVSVSNQTSGNPTFSLHQEITSPEVTHEIHDSEGCNFLSEELPDIDSFNDIHPYFDPLSGSTTYSSNSLLEEFTDELALITYPSNYDDNLQFNIESDLREIEFLLYQGKDSSLKDLIDQTDLANLVDYFVDPTP